MFSLLVQMQAEEMPARVQKVVSSGEDWQDVCGGIADVEARVDQRGAVHRVRVAVVIGARLPLIDRVPAWCWSV